MDRHSDHDADRRTTGPDDPGQAAFVPERNVRVRIRNAGESMYMSLADRDLALSETAAFLWRRIDGTVTVDQLAADLAAEYGIDHGDALADASELVAFLVEQEFVHASGAGEVWWPPEA